MPCKRCGSHAINHRSHGRDGSDPDLCDVCYWRKRDDEENEVIKAAENLVAQKGRYNTEIAYKRLEEAIRARRN